jgi:hypothetical protein
MTPPTSFAGEWGEAGDRGESYSAAETWGTGWVKEPAGVGIA